MVKAVVLYGPPEDPDVFERYYAETHTALATAIPGLQRFEAAQGIATPEDRLRAHVGPVRTGRHPTGRRDRVA